VLVPPGGAQSAGASCPTGSKPLGGGGFSDSGLTAVTTSGSFPVPTGWVVSERNAGATASRLTAFVVCGKVSGYRLVSLPVSVLSDGLTLGGSMCPGTKVVLGGGTFTSQPGLAIDLYSTFPIAGGWDADLRYVAAPGDPTVLHQQFAICAGTRGA
jgi:hypothetical protein